MQSEFKARTTQGSGNKSMDTADRERPGQPWTRSRMGPKRHKTERSERGRMALIGEKMQYWPGFDGADDDGDGDGEKWGIGASAAASGLCFCFCFSCFLCAAGGERVAGGA